MKRLAESSEHADSESISFVLNVFFECSLLKASKAVKTTFGPVCVEDSRSYPSARVQKKNLAFEITSSKKLLKFIFNDMIRTAWLSRI